MWWLLTIPFMVPWPVYASATISWTGQPGSESTISWLDVYGGVGTIAAALAGVLIALVGAGMLLDFLGGKERDRAELRRQLRRERARQEVLRRRAGGA